MARKGKSGINKSQVIRELKDANPEMGPTEIAKTIEEKHGVKVTPATVSTVLSTAKKRQGKVGRPGRPKGSGKKVVKVRVAAGGDPYLGSLIKAKQLVKEMGGFDKARNALDALAELMDK